MIFESFEVLARIVNESDWAYILPWDLPNQDRNQIELKFDEIWRIHDILRSMDKLTYTSPSQEGIRAYFRVRVAQLEREVLTVVNSIFVNWNTQPIPEGGAPQSSDEELADFPPLDSH